VEAAEILRACALRPYGAVVARASWLRVDHDEIFTSLTVKIPFISLFRI
jgi:hypothetical protein